MSLKVSAFIRLKNEEEFIIPVLASIYKTFDEIVCILNNCTDRTEEKIRLFIDKVGVKNIKICYYDKECATAGTNYQKELSDGKASLAEYYTWCVAQCSNDVVCKWDGDMIALDIKDLIPCYQRCGSINLGFTGIDIAGFPTTAKEVRIFNRKYATYVDDRFYEVLKFQGAVCIDQPLCLHMKMARANMLGKPFFSVDSNTAYTW